MKRRNWLPFYSSPILQNDAHQKPKGCHSTWPLGCLFPNQVRSVQESSPISPGSHPPEPGQVPHSCVSQCHNALTYGSRGHAKKALSSQAPVRPRAQTVLGSLMPFTKWRILEHERGLGYTHFARLPSGLSVGTAQTEKEGLPCGRSFSLYSSQWPLSCCWRPPSDSS